MTPPTVRATPADNSAHEAIASWFLGPKAENIQFLKDAFDSIVTDMQQSRLNYHPEDMVFVTSEVQDSAPFKNSMQKLKDLLTNLSSYMAVHNIPFYSPRYNAHMLADLTMPGVLGYLLTMMYNPNNVAPEASPLTSLIEYEVGQDLCVMLGYRRQPSAEIPGDNGPYGWGHITCGGSIANLESMWVARNLKYYPLSLRDAMAPGAPFSYIAPTFKVQLCDGTEKLFTDCSVWELLNLDVATVLDLAPRLTSEYGMSSDYVQKVMADYIIQTVTKEKLDAKYGIEKKPQYFVASTKHYSWPKGAAITGIGSENMIDVQLDNRARMDVNHLESLLEDCLSKQQSVYAVVCILGSTEHGAVDPLADVVTLRTKLQARGMNFMIHVDGAWGGYFASIIREIPLARRGTDEPIDTYVPEMTLLPHTKLQLENLQYADSITIDPHKSGYIPYPAGGLCYRDGRARYLVTWTSPYIDFQEEGVQTMGTYGVEGSKPGAAPVAAWMSHEVIGLHKEGYGALLGESLFTGVKFYCEWATMADEDLLVVPFNMLPAETTTGATLDDVEAQKQFIRDRILKPTNSELVVDDEAMQLVSQLGSDLMINAFACNFKIDGKINSNVSEANALNSKIYEQVSVLSVNDVVTDKDIWVMSTSLSQGAFGEALSNFKRRLGLEGDEDLFVLVNVSMSPFPTEANFVNTLADSFKSIANRIIQQSCIPRNTVVPDYHTFIMQGTDKVHLVALPVFQMANFRDQVIVAADIPDDILQAYATARAENPNVVFTLSTASEMTMSDILSTGTFTANIDQGLPPSRASLSDPTQTHFQTNVQVSNIRVIKNRSLDSTLLESTYPNQMPFYLYGTRKQQHIDHVLLCSPNVQLTADQVTLTIDPDSGIYEPGFEQELAEGLVAVLDDVREVVMQPFDSNHQPSFFAPSVTFRVSLHRDSAKGPVAGIASSVLARATLVLGSCVYTDCDLINRDLTTPADQSGNLVVSGASSDNSKSTAAEALKQFIAGTPSLSTASKTADSARTTPLLAKTVPSTFKVGDAQVADRYGGGGKYDGNSRNRARRSAWKASWETAVGRSS
ncbi:pyridoxal phosphate-dependent transferase [Cristinia sonorae]|uniref:Pyridoxal phosphate-dependent transferase n=1 Tax=Cristinia sonorae TaxID=1940300 RepID=A0A8K0UEH4_9AGAR|nr:pyridoxal phosphate-dependent transferase [Cristinia sonorae]